MRPSITLWLDHRYHYLTGLMSWAYLGWCTITWRWWESQPEIECQYGGPLFSKREVSVVNKLSQECVSGCVCVCVCVRWGRMSAVNVSSVYDTWLTRLTDNVEQCPFVSACSTSRSCHYIVVLVVIDVDTWESSCDSTRGSHGRPTRCHRSTHRRLHTQLSRVSITRYR